VKNFGSRNVLVPYRPFQSPLWKRRNPTVKFDIVLKIKFYSWISDKIRSKLLWIKLSW